MLKIFTAAVLILVSTGCDPKGYIGVTVVEDFQPSEQNLSETQSRKNIDGAQVSMTCPEHPEYNFSRNESTQRFEYFQVGFLRENCFIRVTVGNVQQVYKTGDLCVDSMCIQGFLYAVFPNKR